MRDFAAAVMAVGLAWVALSSPGGAAERGLLVTARRLPQNPLITTRSSATLGDNINGPTVIRVPEWIDRPLGRYYMYFAHHMGRFVRLAYANAIEGPWTVYEPGVLPVEKTAFYRPQPDPPENLEDFYTHVASPEIDIDTERRQLVMWVHGWWTNGTMWPVGEDAAREWARRNGYGQYTQTTTSKDGLHFDVRPEITRTSYLRVFRHEGSLYGMSRLGLLLRAEHTLAVFQSGPNPFRETKYANRIRHVAVFPRGRRLFVFLTGIGDAPERILASTIDLDGPWTGWKASEPVDVLRPDAPYECPTLPDVPSESGDVKGMVRQLRDPAVFEENGKTFLFYSYCGEQGIAGAELTFAR